MVHQTHLAVVSATRQAKVAPTTSTKAPRSGGLGDQDDRVTLDMTTTPPGGDTVTTVEDTVTAGIPEDKASTDGGTLDSSVV